MKTFQANIYRLFLNLSKIAVIFVGFGSVMVYLIYTQSISDGEMLYQMYTTMITFFWIMYFIIQNGDLFEKKVIRYYVEAETKRFPIIIALYLENIGLYIMSVLIIFVFFLMNDISVNFTFILSYFLLYILYLSIVLNILLIFKKTSTALLVSILCLWIFPNLINYVFENTTFYDLQLGYYLSPDTFVMHELIINNIIVYGVYFSLMLSASFLHFEYAEL